MQEIELVISVSAEIQPIFSKETVKMRVSKGSFLLLAILSFLLFSGCRTCCGPQTVLDSIIFQNKWHGDIDKIQFNEPSGICWHSQRKTLFVIGDEGDICEIETDGSLIKQKHIRDSDFEGVTHDPATGLLYAVIEEEEAVIEIDPETFGISREFKIPRDFGGKTLLKSGGEGIEAITFIPDPKHAEGGIFYLANQAFTLTDEEDISAVFQVELPLRTKMGEPRLIGYFKPGIIDLSGLHYDQATGHILLISDSTNTLLEYSLEHELLNVYAFPGDNQEGITLDPEGFVYIAQDSGGIIKLKWLR